MREDVIRAHAELPGAVRAHPPAAAVGLEPGAQAHAPHLHARALPGPGGADPRARARLRPDHRHHRRLPGRDRGGLRADAGGGRGRSATTAPSPSSTRRGAGPRRPTLPGQLPHEVKVARMERLVEVIQRRARERAQRFVGRTLEVLVEGPSRTDPSRLRGRSRHNKVVNFAGLGSPGESSTSRSTVATSQTLSGEASLLAAPPAEPRSRRPVRAPMRTYVRAMDESQSGREQRDPPAGVPRRGGGAPFRGPRGARDPFLRGPCQVDPQPRARGVADAVPLDDQPVPGLQPCVFLLRLG